MGFLIAAIIIILILCLRISFRIGVADETRMQLGVGLIRITLAPSKEKTLKLRDYELRRFRARRVKEEAARLKAEQAALEKEKAEKSDSPDKKTLAKRRKNTETRLGLREKTDIPELIGKLTRVAATFIKRFGKHLRVRVKRIRLIIATEDAAQTAILYGATIAAVQNFFALFTSTETLVTGRDSEIVVDTDFTLEKMQIDIDLTFSFRLWQVFDMALRAGIEFLKKSD